MHTNSIQSIDLSAAKSARGIQMTDSLVKKNVRGVEFLLIVRYFLYVKACKVENAVMSVKRVT